MLTFQTVGAQVGVAANFVSKFPESFIPYDVVTHEFHPELSRKRVNFQ